MMQGSCHCGKVRYESAGKVIRMANCHCDDCRKITGSPFGTAILVESSGFKVTQGEGELTAYPSSPGKARNFCKHCGTHLFSRMQARPEVVIVRAGTVDSGLEARPQMHIWVKAKAPWYDILDALPQLQEGVPVK